MNLDKIQNEFTSNYLSYLALSKAFIPFLQSKESESALILFVSTLCWLIFVAAKRLCRTTSLLALIPIPRCPNYCASKAALHHFILVLREQMKGSKIKIVELYPPAVQSEPTTP